MIHKSFFAKIFFAFFSVFSIFPQTTEKSFDTKKNSNLPVRNLIWNDNDKLFGYVQGNVVCVRSAENNQLLNTFTVDDIQEFYFAKEGKDDALLSLYQSGAVSLWNLKATKPLFTDYYGNVKTFGAVALSSSGEYVASSLYDGTIQLYFKNMGRSDSKNLVAHTDKIKYLKFSPDEKFLISIDVVGNMVLWNCDYGREVWRTSGINTDLEVFPSFCSNGKNFFVNDRENSFLVYSTVSTAVKIVFVNSKIKQIVPLSNPKNVAVICDNKVCVLNIEVDKNIGFIPPLNESDMISCAFNSDDTSVVIAFEDGSIYKLIVADCMLLPDEFPPDYKIIADEEIVVRGGKYKDRVVFNNKTLPKEINFDEFKVIAMEETKVKEYSPLPQAQYPNMIVPPPSSAYIANIPQPQMQMQNQN